MTVLTVGPGEEYSSITAAYAASNPGDTIDVEAGVYTDNFLIVSHSITLQAIGGMVSLVENQSPPNDKGMITAGTVGDTPDITVNGFEISGVNISAKLGGNGAAIRYQSGNLVLNDDYFHNNQDGLLGTPLVAGTGNIVINDSQVGFNGVAGGSTHNIYVGMIDSLNIHNSYIHDADVGMEIQSRAENNEIVDNRIFDNNSTASYDISLPNGGDDVVSRNVIEKGLHSQNHTTIIAFMQAPGDGPASFSSNGHWPNSSLTVDNNVFVNDIVANVPAVWNDNHSPTPGPVNLNDNSFWNVSQEVLGPATVSSSVNLASRPTLDMNPPWVGSSDSSGSSGGGG
jgi:hypothetical protein